MEKKQKEKDYKMIKPTKRISFKAMNSHAENALKIFIDKQQKKEKDNDDGDDKKCEKKSIK